MWPSDPKLLIGSAKAMFMDRGTQHCHVCLCLHLVFLLNSYLARCPMELFSLLNPSGTQSKSMGAGLYWTPWLKEGTTLTLWLVGKLKAVPHRESGVPLAASRLRHTLPLCSFLP